MGKKDKGVADKSTKQKNAAAIEERFKKAMALQPPDENPFKMENENVIDHFRPAFRNDWDSIKATNRKKTRENRPKKPQRKSFF